MIAPAISTSRPINPTARIIYTRARIITGTHDNISTLANGGVDNGHVIVMITHNDIKEITTTTADANTNTQLVVTPI